MNPTQQTLPANPVGQKRLFSANAPQRSPHEIERELGDRLHFESFVAELFLHFIRLPSDQVDGAIENAQRLLCKNLGLDRSSLFQRFDQEPEALLLTHVHERGNPTLAGRTVEKRADPELCANIYWVRTDTEPPAFSRLNAKPLFPWVCRQLERHEMIVVSSLEELPEEAALDRESFQHYATQSTVVVPLMTGGTWLGCLSFASLRERRNWSESEVKRFRFVADVFANALARKRADEALRESEERLSLAIESSGTGLWSMQVGTDRVWVTPRVREFFGFAPGQELTYESFARLAHPEDLERVRQAVQHAVETGADLRVEYRIVPPGGRVRWILARGRRQCDASGRPQRLLGATMDITERKRAEQALRASEERFRQVAEPAGDFIWEIDANGLYTYSSPSIEKILGYTAEEVVGKAHFYELFAPEVREELKAAAFRVFAARQPFRAFANPNVRKDGRVVHLETSGMPVLDEGGNLVGYRGTDTDVTERKQAEEALAKSYAEIKKLKDRLQAETDYLKAEIKVRHAHGQIIGQSKGIKRVLHHVEQVAPADCPVLIAGETGTGKELIAQEIHRLSVRKERVMVLVNCAALPSALVESELFGRERGAYTGALTSQVGRFELANGSTIFLDEVAELSTEVQAKLLRVLQEGEFQRLGSPKTHKVDVRVLAATNRDLADEVRKGRFREDLYYRLKVFPIDIPPLRERVEDIPLLVFAFMEEFSRRMGKRITRVPRKAMETLQNHAWPGNIRELRNVIEHSVILSSGDLMRLSVLGDSPIREAQPVTLAEAEREHILKTLESTGWRIKGPHGAAQRLDLQPSTLYSRMQKLGIPHRRQKDEMTTAV